MSRRWAWMLIGLAATVGAQDEYRYVDQPAAGNVFALGYPVPRPVESATPIDGFRSYAALHARLQDLAMRHAFIDAAIVGQTIAGRDIWAYAIGDPGTDTVHADAESSVLVNGGIHAREWGTPELTTGLIEAFAERAGDGFLVDYLIDNVHFVVLPVNNIDGFLQTQRYPDRVLVGRDPRFPEDWPRDGRMRRKNMRGVDEDLDSRGDHLLGIDLNRNNPPFWNSGSGSSGNPDDLTYRGLASFSEPETRALENAAAFARADRLRWYQDTHSFTQKFFSVRTFNERRNAIQADMLDSYRRFHNALSLERHGVERTYLDDPDPPGAGIGVTAEYFAETYQVPSWTLEIEPRNGGVDYGGLGAEHDGFILPDSEVGRFREDMADTHLAVAYRQAGPPSLAAWRVLDAARGPVAEGEWRPAGNGLRVLDVSVYRPVVLGEALTMQLSFDKPMRWSDGGGPRQAPGHEVPFTPEVILASGTPNATVLPASEGVWLEQDVRRYRFDRFEFPLTLPTDLVLDGVETLPISVVARDFTDVPLDARPETVADWADGAWTGYEDATGTAGDVGGPDRTSISLPVSATAVDALALAIPSPVMDEGRAFRLEVERTGSGTGVVETEVEITQVSGPPSGLTPAAATLRWEDGELGSRFVDIAVPDDFAVEAVGVHEITLALVAGDPFVPPPVTLRIEDSDAARPTWRVVEGLPATAVEQLREALTAAPEVAGMAHIELPARRALVFTDAIDLPGSVPLALPRIQGAVTLHGFGALLERDSAAPAFGILRVGSGASLTIRDLALLGGRLDGTASGGAIGVRGELVLENVVIAGSRAGRGGALFVDGGTLTADRLVLVGNHASMTGGALHFERGEAAVTSSVWSSNEAAGAGGAAWLGGDLALSGVLVRGNRGAAAAIEGSAGAGLTLRATAFHGNEQAACGETISVTDLGGNEFDDGSCVP